MSMQNILNSLLGSEEPQQQQQPLPPTTSAPVDIDYLLKQNNLLQQDLDRIKEKAKAKIVELQGLLVEAKREIQEKDVYLNSLNGFDNEEREFWKSEVGRIRQELTGVLTEKEALRVEIEGREATGNGIDSDQLKSQIEMLKEELIGQKQKCNEFESMWKICKVETQRFEEKIGLEERIKSEHDEIINSFNVEKQQMNDEINELKAVIQLKQSDENAMREELERLSITLEHNQPDIVENHNDEQADRLKQKLNELNLQLSQKDTEMSELEEVVRNVKHEIGQLKQIHNIEIHQLHEALEEKELKHSTSLEQINNFESERNSLIEEIKGKENSVADLESKLQESKSAQIQLKTDLEAEIVGLKEALEEALRAKSSTPSVDVVIVEELKEQIVSLSESLKVKEFENSKLSMQLETKESLEIEIDRLRKELVAANEKIAVQTTGDTEFEEQLKQLRLDLNEKLAIIFELEEKVDSLQTDIGQREETHLKELEETRIRLAENEKAIESKASDDKQVATLRSQLNERLATIFDLEGKMDELQTELNEAEERFKKELEAFRTTLAEKESQLDVVQNENKLLGQNSESVKLDGLNANTELEANIAELQEQVASQAQELLNYKLAQKTIDRLEIQIEDMGYARQLLDSDIRRRDEQIRRLNSKLEAGVKKEEFGSLEKERDELKNMKEWLEGRCRGLEEDLRRSEAQIEHYKTQAPVSPIQKMEQEEIDELGMGNGKTLKMHKQQAEKEIKNTVSPSRFYSPKLMTLYLIIVHIAIAYGLYMFLLEK